MCKLWFYLKPWYAVKGDNAVRIGIGPRVADGTLMSTVLEKAIC